MLIKSHAPYDLNNTVGLRPVAFAPGATHGWTREPHHGRYLYGKLMEYFDRHLGNQTE